MSYGVRVDYVEKCQRGKIIVQLDQRTLKFRDVTFLKGF